MEYFTRYSPSVACRLSCREVIEVARKPAARFYDLLLRSITPICYSDLSPRETPRSPGTIQTLRRVGTSEHPRSVINRAAFNSDLTPPIDFGTFCIYIGNHVLRIAIMKYFMRYSRPPLPRPPVKKRTNDLKVEVTRQRSAPGIKFVTPFQGTRSAPFAAWRVSRKMRSLLARRAESAAASARSARPISAIGAVIDGWIARSGRLSAAPKRSRRTGEGERARFGVHCHRFRLLGSPERARYTTVKYHVYNHSFTYHCACMHAPRVCARERAKGAISQQRRVII